MVQDLEKMKTNLNKLDSRTIQKKKNTIITKRALSLLFSGSMCEGYLFVENASKFILLNSECSLVIAESGRRKIKCFSALKLCKLR